MSLTMYQVSAPVFVKMLKSLSNVLAKAEANAAERKIDPSFLLNDRLAPDMLTMKRQVQIASDHAKGAMSRLAGQEVPKYEDNEATFADLQARIARTIAHVEGFAEADLDGSENRQIKLKVAQRDLEMTGLAYLLNFAMPNFYFHVTTAYAILRHNGAPIGKSDYLAG